MKTLFSVLVVTLFAAIPCAYSQTQTVTLVVDQANQTASFDCTTNQVITILASRIPTGGTNLSLYPAFSFSNGSRIVFGPSNIGPLDRGTVYTGLTNISCEAGKSWNAAATNHVYFPGVLTISVTTPTTQSMIPANAVVIPSDATGPVQIALESSSDLVNWTAALPGTYGNTHSNRFFRVRAIAQ